MHATEVISPSWFSFSFFITSFKVATTVRRLIKYVMFLQCIYYLGCVNSPHLEVQSLVRVVPSHQVKNVEVIDTFNCMILLSGLSVECLSIIQQ